MARERAEPLRCNNPGKVDENDCERWPRNRSQPRLHVCNISGIVNVVAECWVVRVDAEGSSCARTSMLQRHGLRAMGEMSQDNGASAQ